MGFGLKPRLKPFDISKIEKHQIEYFCKTQEIDKNICLKKGLDFNQEIADLMEKPYPHYFVVRTNMEYDVISGLLFQEFISSNELTELPISEKAKKCIDHYIRALK